MLYFRSFANCKKERGNGDIMSDVLVELPILWPQFNYVCPALYRVHAQHRGALVYCDMPIRDSIQKVRSGQLP